MSRRNPEHTASQKCSTRPADLLSQKEKNKYEKKSERSNTNAYLWNLEEMARMILSANQRYRSREETYGHQGWNGVGAMNLEIGIDIYILLKLGIK